MAATAAVMEIDASMGEGGGQIVRTSLALAMCTGTAVELKNIRAHRNNPGLRAQHLAAVHAAAAICGARVSGDTVASRELSFAPGPVQAGRYEVDVGTAGSTLLVLQTILPALSTCQTASEVLLRGGTHNPRAPTFEFVRDSWLPLIERAGFKVQIALERHGFYPAGGGLIKASIEPLRGGRRTLELMERGPVQGRSAEVLLARLPQHIAERELGVLRDRLNIPDSACAIRSVVAHGAGNALQVRLDCGNVTSVFAGFGSRGVSAEEVANHVAYEVERYLQADVAVDIHLADQLLLPLVLAGGGHFSSLSPSLHTKTNATVIQKFLPVQYQARPLDPQRWQITVKAGQSYK